MAYLLRRVSSACVWRAAGSMCISKTCGLQFQPSRPFRTGFRRPQSNSSSILRGGEGCPTNQCSIAIGRMMATLPRTSSLFNTREGVLFARVIGTTSRNQGAALARQTYVFIPPPPFPSPVGPKPAMFCFPVSHSYNFCSPPCRGTECRPISHRVYRPNPVWGAASPCTRCSSVNSSRVG